MLEIAISPCPNDTFLFSPWIEGITGTPPTVHFEDIEGLNSWAKEGRFPLIKLSFACMPKVIDHYELLPVGSALGYNVGPLVISKKPVKIEEAVLAIPGEETTAHLLSRKLLPEPKKKRFCLYHEIYDLLESGEADAGVVIHESRFTYEALGFHLVADLGDLWHERFQLPLPLGGLMLERNHPARDEIVEILQDSYDYAYTHAQSILPFVMQHAQEMEEEVALKHIQTYVNEQTRELSDEGWRAIEVLTDAKVTRLCPT